MKTERMCYSYSKLCAAADMVKAINWKVSRKNEHFAKYIEIEKVFTYCAENINRYAIDPELDLREYRNAAYNYKNYTNTELNKILKRAYLHITWELNGILKMIRSGEVDTVEELYI